MLENNSTLGPSICKIIASITPVLLADCSCYSCFKSQTSGYAVQFRIGRLDHLFLEHEKLSNIELDEMRVEASHGAD